MDDELRLNHARRREHVLNKTSSRVLFRTPPTGERIENLCDST